MTLNEARSIFSLGCASDIHIGHPNTETQHILKSLEEAFPYNNTTKDLDIIFLSGDVFDRLLQYADVSIEDIEDWAMGFMKMCASFDIVLRILEGTPSHDWKQSKMFEKINRVSDIGCDVKHVKILSIEHLERFNKTVLYVPDEWDPDPENTWKQVQDLLEIHGLKQVDFAIMHGNFPHQLPQHLKVPMHNPDKYQSIVKYIIIIGHIHKHSMMGKIICPGSLDRLCHGEEEPKGHIRFYLKEDETYTIRFIENKNAKIYKTIDCSQWSLEESLINVEEIISGLEKGSFVRIAAELGNPIIEASKVLMEKYPDIKWTTPKVKDKESTGREMLVDMRAVFQGIDITEVNLSTLLMERIAKKDHDKEFVEYCEKTLQGVMYEN